jgi:hypothetical protein
MHVIARAAKHLGVDATLRKPIRTEALEQVLQELVGGAAFTGVEEQAKAI